MGLEDLLSVSIIIVVTAFSFVILAVVWNAMLPEFQASAINSTTTNSIWMNVSVVVNMWDGMVIIAQALAIFFLLVSVYFLDSHPVFFVAMLFIFIISIFAGGIYSAVWTAFTSNTDINNTVNSYFPMTNILMNNYAVVALVAGFLFLIALYAKATGGIR